jgi:integrase
VAEELTAKGVAELAPRKAPRRVAPNLYIVRETAEADGRWLFIYTSPLLGRRVDMGLGAARDVSLKLAKAEALEHRLAVLKGRCPLTERRAAEAARKCAQTAPRPEAHTFKAVAKLYVASRQAGWKNAKHGAQWGATLEAYVYKVMGGLSVSKIGVAEVMDVLEPIWRTKTETASRVRGRIEAVLDFATVRGWRTGENPARWKGHLDKLLPARSRVAKVRHHAAVPWKDLPALYQRLAGQADISALALRYLILTALRTGEVLGAPARGEIDLALKAHVIPAARMKAGVQHRVPLSDEATAVLAKAESTRTGDWLFNGAVAGRPLSNMALLERVRGLAPGATTHGMRSAFRDWARENGVSREIAETCLAHAIGDKTEAAYARGDLLEPRRDVLKRWSAFLTGKAAKVGDNVKSLDDARSSKTSITA